MGRRGRRSWAVPQRMWRCWIDAGQDFGGAGELGEFGGDLAGFGRGGRGRSSSAGVSSEGSVIPSCALQYDILCDERGGCASSGARRGRALRARGRCRPGAAAFARAVVAQAAPGTPGAGEGAVVRRGPAGRVRRVGRARALAEVAAVRGGDRAVHHGRVRGGLASDAADAAHEPAGARARRSSAIRSRRRWRWPASARSGRTRRPRSTGICGSRHAQSTRARGGCARARWCVWAPARG